MVDLSAIAKWPNVPACYDWLSLDRRGNWRLQGERVTHSGLINFINRQYGVDEAGCWFVQNGPQRVFVSLAYTPWVFRREGENFISHTGEAAGRVKTVYLDEEGSLLLDTELGIGLLDDRDLAGFIAECQPGDEQSFLDLMQGQPVTISWKNLSLQPSATVHVAKRHNFNPAPKAETA
jgi:hypothetical protein